MIDNVEMQVKDTDIDKLVDVAENLVDVVTTKRTLKEKLQSRKFWACVALMVVGVCGMFGLSDNTTAIVCFAIMDIIALLAYVLTEGYIDAVHAKEMLRAIGSFGKMLSKPDEPSTDAENAVAEAEQAYKLPESEA